MDILVKHKEYQKSLAKKNHKTFEEDDYVFTTKSYMPYGRNTLNERVKETVKSLKIDNWEHITSHCLRHSFCYAGLLNDVPLEYMQILMGHSSPVVTKEIYAHFDDLKISNYAKKVNTNRIRALYKLKQNNITA